MRFKRDDKIGYDFSWELKSLNAHLVHTLNGLHKAFVSSGLTINRHFLRRIATDASIKLYNAKSPQSFD